MLARFGSQLGSLDRLRGEVDRLFENLTDGLSPWAALTGFGAFPALNVWEDDHNLYAEAELPGLKMEDLEILACGNELTIKGERKDCQKDGVTYHRRERGVGSFSRVIRLPVPIDANKVEASLKAGVLTVTLPKAQEARPWKIQVKSA
jgi:HSP20 family protein